MNPTFGWRGGACILAGGAGIGALSWVSGGGRARALLAVLVLVLRVVGWREPAGAGAAGCEMGWRLGISCNDAPINFIIVLKVHNYDIRGKKMRPAFSSTS